MYYCVCFFTDKPSFPWLDDVSEKTNISQLLVLAKLHVAYDGIKEDPSRLIFHGIGSAMETLGRKGCGLFVSIVITFLGVAWTLYLNVVWNSTMYA